MGINILAMGNYIPEQKLKNDDFTRFIETNDEWIRTRTGIVERPMAGWEPTWYMGMKAAEAAVKKAGIDVKDIGLVISCTATSDFLTPSMSSVIQHKIGAVNAGAFDLNAACTGFVYALDTARRFVQTDDNMKYVLVVANESLSRFLDFTDRGSCILFGDGAAAAIIEKSDKMYSSALRSDGSGADLLCARSLNVAPEIKQDAPDDFTDNFPDMPLHKLFQNGKEVYKFATKALPEAVTKACEKLDMQPGELDAIVPHQANIRIIETAAKNLNVPMQKFPMYIDKYGNTSSASIPIAFCEAVKEGRICKGDKVCFVGFGGGLTYGAVIFEY